MYYGFISDNMIQSVIDSLL